MAPLAIKKALGVELSILSDGYLGLHRLFQRGLVHPVAQG